MALERFTVAGFRHFGTYLVGNTKIETICGQTINAKRIEPKTAPSQPCAECNLSLTKPGA